LGVSGDAAERFRGSRDGGLARVTLFLPLIKILVPRTSANCSGDVEDRNRGKCASEHCGLENWGAGECSDGIEGLETLETVPDNWESTGDYFYCHFVYCRHLVQELCALELWEWVLTASTDCCVSAVMVLSRFQRPQDRSIRAQLQH
jgi:hypothetical protein